MSSAENFTQSAVLTTWYNLFFDVFVKSSGMENELALRESRETYDVYFLGIVPDINMGNSWSRDKEAQLVDRVEEAQVNLLMQVWDTVWIAIPEQTVWTQIKLLHLGLHLLPLS